MIMGGVQLAIVAVVLMAGACCIAAPAERRADGGSVLPMLARLWVAAVWILVGFFVVNLFAMIATVVLDSFATRWLGTWLPAGWTTRWYGSAWDEFQLGDVLIVTLRGGVPCLVPLPAWSVCRPPTPWPGVIFRASGQSCCCSCCRC